MPNIKDFLIDNKQLYKDILNDNAFSLLFSDNRLSTSQTIRMIEMINTTIIGKIPAYTNMNASGIRAKLFNDLSTRIISSVPNNNEYIKIIATANNIYIISNTTKQLTSKMNISIIHNAIFIDTDIVILSENNVIKHIGLIYNNTINWSYGICITKDMYIQNDIPNNKLSKQAIATAILNNLR
jgi:hypothetical protein